MCLIDDAEPCEFWNETRRTARKTHKCSDCGRKIRPGERYRTVATKWDGNFSMTKECAHCEAAGVWLIDRCGGYPIASVKEDLTNHWYEGGVHEIQLARLIIGARRKWTRRDGTPVPLPQVVLLAELERTDEPV